MFTVRTLSEDDLEKLMEWRMSPEVTRYMFTDPQLTIQEQIYWFRSIQDKNDQKRWIVDVDGVPAGTIYLENIDWDKKRTSWGYFIGERKLRSMHLAISLELSLYDYVFTKTDINEVYCDIISFNSGVIKLHKLCGCRILGEIKNAVKKNGNVYDITQMNLTKDEWKKNKSMYQDAYQFIAFE